MNKTSAVAINIQAVSPLLIVETPSTAADAGVELIKRVAQLTAKAAAARYPTRGIRRMVMGCISG